MCVYVCVGGGTIRSTIKMTGEESRFFLAYLMADQQTQHLKFLLEAWQRSMLLCWSVRMGRERAKY